MKRTRKEVRKAILEALKDNKPHAYGDIERKANTNWQTVRDHCEDLILFDCVKIVEDHKIQITKKGLELLEKI